MRRYLALGLLGLAGCANFCDTIFRARNVCRDQVASQPTVAAPAPAVVMGPTFGCASIGCACASPVFASEPMVTDVYASPVGCECAAPVVMGPQTVVGSPIMSPPIVGEPVNVGTDVPITNASAVETDGKKPHPMLRPFRWMIEHHRNK